MFPDVSSFNFLLYLYFFPIFYQYFFYFYIFCVHFFGFKAYGSLFQVPAPRFIAPGSCSRVRCSRFLLQGSLLQVSVSGFIVPVFCSRVHGSRFLLLGSLFKAPAPGFMVPGYCSRVHCSRFMLTGSLFQVPAHGFYNAPKRSVYRKARSKLETTEQARSFTIYSIQSINQYFYLYTVPTVYPKCDSI